MNVPKEKAFWTDSHCHLAMEDFRGDMEAVVDRAASAGVARMLVVGTTPSDWERCAQIASASGFRSTAGLHPHEASSASEELYELLGAALDRPAVAALGEIGLDYHYDLSPRDVQIAAFERQMEMAKASGLPVVIHSRSAFEDTCAVLRASGNPRGVMHCFTYSRKEAEAFLEMGLLISFSGIITFPKAEEIRDAARVVPPDKIMVETDAPYLAPVPHRGRRCEPAHVAVTGRFLADLLKIPTGEFQAATSANSARLLSF